MLLFICYRKDSSGLTWESFNTSHVTLYRIYGITTIFDKPVSIHLMLLFIGRSSAVWTVPLCCFNTSHVTLYPHSRCCTRCCDSRFNTSHVTLYLHVLQPLRLFLPFQYISCYSLSDVTFTTMSDKVKFQYISCYSLSEKQLENL